MGAFRQTGLTLGTGYVLTDVWWGKRLLRAVSGIVLEMIKLLTKQLHRSLLNSSNKAFLPHRTLYSAEYIPCI